MTTLETLEATVRQLWKPPPRLALSEWADASFTLPPGDANAGRWHTLPYQRGIMDAVSDPAIERVSVMKSSRVGYTKCFCAAIGYYIEHDPCPILVVQPTIEDARKHSKEDVAPMLATVPALEGLISAPRTRDSDNTILDKLFRGGSLSLVGANSPRGFRRTSRRVVIFDEVDGYPHSAGTEGDPIELGIRRTEYYWNRKILAGSTPTTAGYSVIERLFEAGDQRRYWVPCPTCGVFQVLKFPNLKWPEGQPELAYLVCAENGCVIEHKSKRPMIEGGEWRADKPEHFTEHNRHASFHVWAGYSYSPNATWGQLALEFIKAKRGGTLTLRTFVNTVLGEVWQDRGEAPEWEPLMRRRETYPIGRPPHGVLLLTAGVDVQKDRCFDAETEILTRRGWIKFPDLTMDSEVATANLSTDTLEYQRPTRLVQHRHTGDMLRVFSATADLLVTPDHRMVAYKGSYPVYPRIVEARDLKMNHRLKARIAHWDGMPLAGVLLEGAPAEYPIGKIGTTHRDQRRGRGRARICINGVRREKAFDNRQVAQRWLLEQALPAAPPTWVNADEFSEFVGWFISEGHLGRSYSVHITQNEGPNADRIAMLLKSLPFNFRKWSDGGGRRVVFSANNKALWTWLGRECGRLAHNKRIPRLFIGASRAILERLLAGMYLGDGWVQQRPGRKAMHMYVTVSRGLADDLQEALVKLGWRANIARRPSTHPNRREQFVVSRLNSQVIAVKSKRDGRMILNIARQDYDGQVYCATVPNGTLVCRRNGKMFVAGNCVYEVVGWGRGKVSWSVDYGVLPGDTADLDKGPWIQLDALLARRFRHAGGVEMPITMLAVDSGYNTQQVYHWARRYPMSRVIAVKGQAGTGGALIGSPNPVDLSDRGRKLKRGYKVWPVVSGIAKSELYGWLRLMPPLEVGGTVAPGFCHFPEYGEDYFRELTAEQLIPHRTAKGFVMLDWTLIEGRQNHALDCRVYARAAAAIVGLDRFRESDWQTLEAAVGQSPPPPPPKPAASLPAAPAALPPGSPPPRSTWIPRRSGWLR